MNEKEKGIITILVLLLLCLGVIIITIKGIKEKTKKIEIEQNKIKETQKQQEEKLKEHLISAYQKVERQERIKKEQQEKAKKEAEAKKQAQKKEKSVQISGTYKLTHYGWDCCKSGLTATGYNVKNTIYYNDAQYGQVRIVAMSKAMPLYSIIKIKNYKYGGDITAIVIDRGVGNGVIDLLTESEAKSSQLGIQKGVTIEVLRKGK